MGMSHTAERFIQLKSETKVRTVMLDEIENHFTNADCTALQLAMYSKRNGTDSIKKMKFNQIVDDATEKFEVAHAVNFQTLQNKHSYQ